MPPRRQPAPAVDPRAVPRPEEPVVDPAAPPVVHPEDAGLHPFLRFTREEDRVDRNRLLARAAAHGYDELRYISWEGLARVQLQDRAETTCGPYWRRLFSISDDCCQELAIEFFSTFHLMTPLLDYAREDALSFRLGGVEQHMSLRRFAVLMGLYREEELDTPAFTAGITTWPEGVTAHSFWREIGIGEYTVPNLPKSTKIRDPFHRLLHRAIVHTLTCHGESSGSVTLTDLFYLYCIISGRPCQIAVCLARYLYQVRQARSTMGIYGGGYVYRLAKAMHIMPLAELEALTLCAFATPIDTAMMLRMRMVRKEGTRYILLGRDGVDWIPQRQGDEDQGVEGQGVDDQGVEDQGDERQPRKRARQDPGASGSGTRTEPQIEVEREQPAAHTSPRGHPPPAQQQPLRVYQRRYQDRISRLRRELRELRDTTQSELRTLREIQRLEYEHAEAHRQYTTRMLQILAGASSEPFPDPPERPQRLIELLAGASFSGTTHQQAPP